MGEKLSPQKDSRVYDLVHIAGNYRREGRLENGARQLNEALAGVDFSTLSNDTKQQGSA